MKSKSWDGKSQRRKSQEKVREEKRKSEKVRRKKIQVREKVGKSRNTVFFQRFVARKHMSKSTCTKNIWKILEVECAAL